MEITEYSTKYCPACRGIASELKKLKKEGIKVKVIDCGKNSSKCKGITYIPTLVIKKGRKSKKVIGFATVEDIKREFKKL